MRSQNSLTFKKRGRLIIEFFSRSSVKAFKSEAYHRYTELSCCNLISEEIHASQLVEHLLGLN